MMFQRAGWVALLLAVLLAAPAFGRNAARVLESSDTEIILELATDTYALSDKVIGGEPFMVVKAPGMSYTTESGLPELPEYSALIGVPFGARLTLDVISDDAENLGRSNPLPAPKEDIVWDGTMAVPTQEYAPDLEYYEGAGAYPPVVATLGAEGTLRHQRIAAVLFYPFQHSARTGSLTLHRRIQVRITIEKGRASEELRSDVPNEPEWNRTYDQLILNQEQAREWRMRPAPRRATARAARVPGVAYKITTAESGLHRIDFSELAAAGMSAGASLDDIAVYQRSYDDTRPDPFVHTPVAIVVADEDSDGYFDGDDYLLFQAQSFEEQRMPGGYEDRYGDDNVYWLAEDADLALRMGTRPGWLDEPGLTPPTSFRDTVRFEQDVFFYPKPQRIDLDLYLWTSYATQGDSYALPFALHGIDPDGDLRMRARYQGMTSSAHSIDLSVSHGGSPENFIGTFAFEGVSLNMSQDIYQSGPIPTSYVADGSNTLIAKGANGRSGANLDWFEFAYDRLFAANEGKLAFTNAGEEGISQFSVEGFGSRNVRLFDVTDPFNTVELELPEADVTGSQDGYTLVFQDDVPGFTRYEAVEDGAYARAVKIDRRDDPGLRNHEAEVIVVAYEGFEAGLAPLISHREGQGWSVALAAAGEVYDEFGGGLKSSQALKNYFGYAFREWSTEPQFVMLVGDASEDTKGLSGTSQPDFMPTYLGAGSFAYPQMTASDQWYISSDQSPYLPQMFIGRLPVGSTTELGVVVSKILGYEQSDVGGDWRSRVAFVADDEWKNLAPGGDYSWYASESDFTDISLELADMVAASPAGIDTTIFALRRYTEPFHAANGVDHDPQPWQYEVTTQNYVRANVTPALVHLLSDGAAIVNYQGHGNRSQMTHEQLVMSYENPTFNDIEDLTNNDKPFIFMGFSCHLAEFHNYLEGSSSGVESVAEQMLLQPLGRGSVASFACAAAANLTDNQDLNRDIFSSFFLDPTPEGPPGDFYWPRWTLGSILGNGTVKKVMAELFPERARNYVLLGDPLLHMEMSPPSIRVTLNGQPLANGEYLEASGGNAVTLVADIIDEVEIDPATISVTETGGGEPGVITVDAVGDTLSEVGRWYRVTYETTIQERMYDIVFEATDLTGQTSRFVIHVPEGGGLRIYDVANYPNPFFDTTRIIYVLNQSDVDVRIDIYTVGGRLIRRMDAPGELNYNEIEWDGVDGDGDPVANGVYLYVIEARSSDGKVVTSDVGRMVVARGPRFDHLRR